MRFQRGSCGAGLLLLRAAIGAIAIVQGKVYLSGSEPSIVAAACGGVLILAGAALVLGLFTTMSSLFIGSAAIAAALSWLPGSAPDLFEAPLSDALVTVVAAAIVLIGPGAWSVDARLSGLREIIIPRAPVPQKR